MVKKMKPQAKAQPAQDAGGPKVSMSGAEMLYGQQKSQPQQANKKPRLSGWFR